MAFFSKKQAALPPSVRQVEEFPAPRIIRLRDLCVNLEAASPGEVRSGGAGWTIRVGFAESPFGRCLIAESPRGICHLSFVERGKDKAALAGVRQDWPKARVQRDNARAKKWAARIFGRSSPRAANLRACVRGTAFQVRVWRALLEVRRGSLVSYGTLAARVGAPKASRAVGSAVGDNPLAYLIPCHRVIRGTGVLGDYRWGRVRKRALIARESAGK